jgi:hypothetical protein
MCTKTQLKGGSQAGRASVLRWLSFRSEKRSPACKARIGMTGVGSCIPAFRRYDVLFGPVLFRPVVGLSEGF